jgi:hypothetical protein
MIMHTLSGNLTEGPKPPVKKPLAQGVGPDSEADAGDNELVVVADTRMAPGQSPLPVGVATRIAFQFKMDGINAYLYSGSSSLVHLYRLLISTELACLRNPVVW